MKNTILKELVKFRLNYHRPYSSDELEVMAEDWAGIIEKKNVSIDVFVDACEYHKQGSEYFPNIKNLLDRCSDVWAERQRNIKKLPEPIPDLTPEQIKAHADNARKATKGMLKDFPKSKRKTRKQLQAEIKQVLEV